jgi:hypothetical protein
MTIAGGTSSFSDSESFMLSRITIAEHGMVVPSDVAEAFDAFEREMFKLKKLTDPSAIAAQELACVQSARHLSTVGNFEPCTATDAQFLKYVRDLRVQMDTDPNWQEEPPPVVDPFESPPPNQGKHEG